MSEAARALGELWDRAVGLAERVDRSQWSAPTPCAGLDVEGLVGHMAMATLATTPRDAGRDQLLTALRTARQHQRAEIAALGRAAGNGAEPDRATARMLGAHCLDMWVHVYDLSTALGEPVDLDGDSAALAEACRMVLRFAPQLFTSRVGAAEGDALRISLRGGLDHEGTVRVQNGRAQWSADADGAVETVSGSAGAFVLLVSGRGGAHQWRAADALEWSGATGEAFVAKARLLG